MEFLVQLEWLSCMATWPSLPKIKQMGNGTGRYWFLSYGLLLLVTDIGLDSKRPSGSSPPPPPLPPHFINVCQKENVSESGCIVLFRIWVQDNSMWSGVLFILIG